MCAYRRATILSTAVFNANDTYKDLSLWLFVNGNTSVMHNGVKVFEQPVRHTRHYNQFNLNAYIYLLKKGEKTIEINVVQEDNRTMNFDYGLTAF